MPFSLFPSFDGRGGFFWFCLWLLPLWSSHPSALSTARNRITFTTDHFYITVDRKKADRMDEWAAWMEALWQQHRSFYGYSPPERLQCVLLDEEDISNGFAFAANGWIVLYLPPANFQLRGPTSWFPNVAAHELAHVFTLQKMGGDRRFLGLNLFMKFQLHSRRMEGSADFSFLPDDIPAWLAEGLAQYGSLRAGFDTLDSHRRMLVKQAAQDGSLLSLAEMATFSADARSSELIYAQGFSFVDWLYRNKGDRAVNKMMEAAKRLGWRRAFKEGFGTGPDSLYSEWKKSLAALPPIALPLPAITPSTSKFLPYVVEQYATPLADGSLCRLSSASNAYGQMELRCRYPDGGDKTIMRDVEAPLHRSADGKALLWSAARIQWRTGARIRDLYRYSIPARRVQRLTRGARTMAATETSDGQIYFITSNAGKTRLNALHKGKLGGSLTARTGWEFSDITVGRSENELLLTAVRGQSSDIFALDRTTGILTPLLHGKAQERDPWAQDSAIFFSSDENGYPAIFSYHNDSVVRVSPVGLPAFTPALSSDTLLLSQYGPTGFTLGKKLNARDSSPTDLPKKDSSQDLTQPTLAKYQKLSFDRTRMEWMGYAVSLGYGYAPSTRIDLGLEENAVPDPATLNPCNHQAFAGGQSLWLDPGLTTEFSFAAEVGHCMEKPRKNRPYLAAMQFAYVLKKFAPDLLLAGNYRGQEFDWQGNHGDLSLIHTFQLLTGLSYALGSYSHILPFLLYQGIAINFNSSDKEQLDGLGFALGSVLDFTWLRYATDQVANGLNLQGNALMSLNANPIYLTQVQGGAYINAAQRLFLSLQGNGLLSYGSEEVRQGEGWAMQELWFPARSFFGMGQGRGPVLRSLSLRFGLGIIASQNEAEQDGSAASQSLASVMKPASSILGPKPLTLPKAAINLGSTDQDALPLAQAGIVLKTLGIFPHVSYWQVGMIMRTEHWSRPWWVFQVSL